MSARAPRLADTEPATVAEAVRMLLAALVAAGWLAIDEATVNWIVTGLGLVASVIATAWSRHRVTPVAVPTSAWGHPLVPAGAPHGPDAP